MIISRQHDFDDVVGFCEGLELAIPDFKAGNHRGRTACRELGHGRTFPSKGELER